jgi:hypothetical protein
MRNILRNFFYLLEVYILSDYYRVMRKELRNCTSLLDVGCGADSPMKPFTRTRFSVGVDAFKPSIDASRAKGIHSEYCLYDVTQIDALFPPESFDCVVANDVIEHFAKDDGLFLLSKMERIAKRKIVVFTPNGFLPQQTYDNNVLQIHKSGWTVAEMRGLGYAVTGIKGLKCLRGECGVIRYRPKVLWMLVSYISQLFVRTSPDRAFQILCIKEKR